MSQTDFQKLIDRVMTDEAFSKQLASNPESTLKSIGVDATPEMLEAMKGVDANSLKQLASAFGDDRAAL
jgi:predicted molibdopterin-dependent oxidoreductase YjgC